MSDGTMGWLSDVLGALTAVNTAILGLIGFFAPRIARRFKTEGDLVATFDLAQKTAKRCDDLAAEHTRFREETRLEIERIRIQADQTAHAVVASDQRTAAALAELKRDVRDGLDEVKQRLDRFLQQQIAPAASRRRRTDG